VEEAQPPRPKLNLEDILAEIDSDDSEPKRKTDVASLSLELSGSLKGATASLSQEPVTKAPTAMEETGNSQMEETPEKGRVDDDGTLDDESILSVSSDYDEQSDRS
jgi:hypothetical protein